MVAFFICVCYVFAFAGFLGFITLEFTITLNYF
jgi:hypothetical protein